MSTTKNKKENGFTLIETLVAISILLIAIVGPMVLVSNGIKASYFARDQITAVYIAQDAMEAMRYLAYSDKNTNGTPTDFADSIFSKGNMNQCDDTDWCRIDTVSLYESESLSPSALNAAIHANESTTLQLHSDGRYHYDTSGSPINTFYQRHINIKPASNGKGVDIQVKVVWMYGSTERSYITYQSLYFK